MAPGPGRPKGSRNKLTREVKAVLQQAFEDLGGVDQLVAWAGKSDRNYTEFLRLWVRLLPLEVKSGPSDDAALLEVLEAAKRRADEMCERFRLEMQDREGGPSCR
jgi:hypothetical protein